jgi:hypothetical protein
MKTKNLDAFGIALITTIGVIHLILMRGEYEEARYLGMLFAASFAGAIFAALGIYRGSLWGWMLGFFIAAGSFSSYVMRCTVGLPGVEIESWLNLYGMLSLFLETIFFVVVFEKALWRGTVLGNLDEQGIRS